QGCRRDPGAALLARGRVHALPVRQHQRPGHRVPDGQAAGTVDRPPPRASRPGGPRLGEPDRRDRLDRRARRGHRPVGRRRRELADWIADPANPLTARVIVNRVWQGHFGRGLVPTPDNFGVRGEPPTHPELLDWLAARFVADGWSLKKLHRLITLSDAYRRS